MARQWLLDSQANGLLILIAQAMRQLCRPYEVLVRTRRRGPPLTLVFRPYSGTPVGMLRRTGQFQDAQLADFHAGPQRDREVGDVGQLQRDVPTEAGIDEPGSGMGEQAQPAQRRLALQPPGQVTGREKISSVEPSTNSPGCSTNGSPLVGSTALVNSSWRCAGSMWVYRVLLNTRNMQSSRTSTLDG